MTGAAIALVRMPDTAKIRLSISLPIRLTMAILAYAFSMCS